jgi:RNA polymerase sigma factor (sigma-70 family)
MTTFPTSHTTLDPSLDDRAALSRYANTGDPSAFAALTQRYQHMVLATCRRVLRSQADAEDAAQETFLKLAKHAGVIRGNAAAWLHACAFGTATDMLRRQGSRVRAERKASLDTAGEAADATANTDDARTWKELEPLLDEALAQLSPEEREAIVGHYLVGRPQKDLAREAGVSPGTMSRRIDAALAALQSRIRSQGVAIASGAALAGALSAGIAATDASAGLAASLAKVGLAETVLNGKRLVVASWLSGKTLGIAACIVGMTAVSATTFIALQSPGLRSAAVAPAALASGDPFRSVARPDKILDPMPLVTSSVDGVFEEAGRIKFGTERIEFSETSNAERRAKLTFKRLETKQEGKLTKIRVQVEAADNVNHGKLGDLVNQIGTMTVRPKGTRLGVDLEFDGLPGSMGEIDMVREQGKDLDASGAEKFAGEWLQLQQWRLSLEPDAVAFLGNGGFVVQKYKVLSWTDEEGLSKVETICLANVMETGAIGKRFKLLLRKQGKEVSFAIHTLAAKQTDAWPSFEVKKANSVRQATFKEE